MKKHHGKRRSFRGYVGFIDYRPHVLREAGSGGPLTLTVYKSKAAAERAYGDVRSALVVFDADWRSEP